MFDPETNDAIFVRNDDGTQTPYPLKSTRPKEVPTVKLSDGSYVSHHDLPVWFMVIMGAICVTILIVGLGLLFYTVDWVNQNITEFERRDAIVEHCLDSEKYTRQECITLAGEK